MKKVVVLCALSIFVNSPSMALEFITGKVTWVEPTYLPGGGIVFAIDSGNATCPAGALLRWLKPDQNNNKAVYATLLTALVSEKRIGFYINDGDSTCYGQYLHLFKN